jgi:hypothetical protein
MDHSLQMRGLNAIEQLAKDVERLVRWRGTPDELPKIAGVSAHYVEGAGTARRRVYPVVNQFDDVWMFRLV